MKKGSLIDLPKMSNHISQLETTHSVITTGHSLAVVIPATFAKKLGIKNRDRVKITLSPQTGQITYTFLNIRQLTLV